MQHVDKRYNSRRWRERTRPRVLRRDMWRCQVGEGCEGLGNHVDHIVPVYPGMPVAMVFDINTLRTAVSGPQPRPLLRRLATARCDATKAGRWGC